MTAKELEDWLKQKQSQSADWQGESGETIGHERCLYLYPMQLECIPGR